MPRPVSIDRSQIIEAARTVFLRNGFRGKTTEIARIAGISEGSIFKHFKTKSNLFLAAMASETGEENWSAEWMSSVGSHDFQSSLENIGNKILQRLRMIVPRLIMASSSGITIPKQYQFQGCPPPPIQHIELLTRFFQAEVDIGRLSISNPQVHAHAFIGSLSHFAWCEAMFDYKPCTPTSYVRSIVTSFLSAHSSCKITKSQLRK